MQVALVHDWLVAQRGGEQVLLELARLFPSAPIYTLVHQRGGVHPEIESHPIRTSPLQRFPLAPGRFRQYLPLFPWAVSTFDLRDFDLILSTSHCVAKAVRSHQGQYHVAYIHTPMRYIWDQMPHYLASLPLAAVTAPLARLGATALRRWDVATANRPQRLLANSHFVRQRIERVWGRSADVVYPPVDVDYFAQAEFCERRGFVFVGALVPYKRVDLAIEVARTTGISLTVVGNGASRAQLSQSSPPNVSFVSNIDRAQLRSLYARSESLLFPAEEDFGMVPVEALAAGCPVVAYGAGGALEVVVDEGPLATGSFFRDATVESLAAAIKRVAGARASGGMARETLLARARRFDRSRFVEEIKSIVSTVTRSPV